MLDKARKILYPERDKWFISTTPDIPLHFMKVLKDRGSYYLAFGMRDSYFCRTVELFYATIPPYVYKDAYHKVDAIEKWLAGLYVPVENERGERLENVCAFKACIYQDSDDGRIYIDENVASALVVMAFASGSFNYIAFDGIAQPIVVANGAQNWMFPRSSNLSFAVLNLFKGQRVKVIHLCSAFGKPNIGQYCYALHWSNDKEKILLERIN